MHGHSCSSLDCAFGEWGPASKCDVAQLPCQTSAIATTPNPAAEATCANQYGSAITVSDGVTTGYEAGITLAKQTGVVCFAENVRSKCYGIKEQIEEGRNALVRGSLAASLNDDVTKDIVLAKLYDSVALACFANSGSNDQGTCKVLSLMNGDVSVAGVVTTTFTKYSIAASRIALATFSKTSAVVCFVERNSQGICKSMTFTDLATQMALNSNNFMFASTAPSSVAVTTFSEARGVVCWMDALSLSSVWAKCQVLFTEGSALTAPGGDLQISQGVVSALVLSTIDSTSAVVCFNDQGAAVKCQVVTLDGTTPSLLKAGTRLSLQSTSATTDITVSATDDSNIIVCYNANQAATCTFLRRLGTELYKAVGTVATRAGSARFLTACHTFNLLDSADQACSAIRMELVQRPVVR